MARPVTLDPTQRSRGWYGLERWRRRALAQLRKDPWCAICLSRGITTVATVADHITPHSYRWNEFWTGELQSLCKLCHDVTKREIERYGFSREIGLDGLPTDPNHPIYRPVMDQKAVQKVPPKPKSPRKQENEIPSGSVPRLVW